MKTCVLILAGGLGKRMNSELPKVLHKLNDKPLLKHVIDTAKQLNPDKIGVVVGKFKSIIQETINDESIEYILQENAQGTGHAVICAENFIKDYDKVLILSGDVPLITLKTLQKLINNDKSSILVNELDEPNGYGRVIIEENHEGKKISIIEDKDCTDEEKQIKLINSGIYCFVVKELIEYLKLINNDNAQKEYYLTDVVKYFNGIDVIKSNNLIEIQGVNNPEQLKELEYSLNYCIGVIGLGFVGNSIYKSLLLKKCNIIGYDNNPDKCNTSKHEILKCKILFLCLPTLFDSNLNSYDKSCIYDLCNFLNEKNYKGIIIIKSTVEPLTTLKLCQKYNNLCFIHNPEFLTAKTAFEDFHNQSHIVLGQSLNCNDYNLNYVKNFYKYYYPNALISICNSNESECMKIFCNNFYSVKIQFFNEIYLLCQKINCDYVLIKDLMLKNGWINSMHTNVPGPDGNLSYGGYCFPKDTNALLQFMKNMNSECLVLEATINERNKLRNDKTNCK